MCFSMNSLMSRRVIDCSSSKRNSASALASSVLPTPLGPEEEERSDGLARIAQPHAAAAHRARDGAHGLVLPDHALGQALLHLEELVALGLEHLGDGDAGPVAEHAARRRSRRRRWRRPGRPPCSRRPRRPSPPRAGASRRAACTCSSSPSRAKSCFSRASSSCVRSRALLRRGCAAKAAMAPRRESSFARISLTCGSSSAISFSRRSRVFTLIASVVVGERRAAAP